MFAFLRGLLSPKHFEPEKDLMGCILRVREVASAAYWWWMLCFSVLYIGAIAAPLVAVFLSIFGIVGMSGMQALCLVTASLVALICLFDPRGRLARIELAFNDLAWIARMDAVIDAQNPQMPERVLRRLARAARCLDSAEAAALANAFSNEEGSWD